MKLRSSFGFLAAVVILDLQCKAFLPSSRSSTVTSRASFDGLNFINEGHLKLFAASSDDKSTLNSQVQNLKKVLAREYTSFFDPMETKYYAPDVTFEDPLTSLAGVASYQKNVDMLAGRTLMGRILFENAKIILHNVTGGEITADGKISDIFTRWSLKVTAKVLPWKPTARFTGISIYKVEDINGKTVIVGQQDFWDSINLRPDSSGEYQKVDKSIATNDFLNQLKPGGFQAQQSAAEVPYELLRRGRDYEIRRYPETVIVEAPYTRRDEGYDLLGSVTRGMGQLAPAVMTVGDDIKEMGWFVGYALPGENVNVPNNFESRGGAKIRVEPGKIVAIGSFNDAALEPVVRKCDTELRDALKRDGLEFDEGSNVKFAQYDAIYSMGDRRGECWVELDKEKCPW